MRSKKLKNGVTLSYQYTGVGEDTLMLIHSSNGTHHQMSFIESYYNKTHSIINVDLPNCGESQQLSGKTSVRNITNTLTELIEFYDLEELTIIGYELGADIARLTSIKCNNRVSKLILISPRQALFDMKITWFIINLISFMMYFILSLFTSTFAGPRKMAWLRLSGAKPKKNMKIETKAMIVSPGADHIRYGGRMRYLNQFINLRTIIYDKSGHKNILNNDRIFDDIDLFLKD